MARFILRPAISAIVFAGLAVPAIAHPGHDHTYSTHAMWEMPDAAPTVLAALVALAGIALAVHVALSVLKRARPANRRKP